MSEADKLSLAPTCRGLNSETLFCDNILIAATLKRKKYR